MTNNLDQKRKKAKLIHDLWTVLPTYNTFENTKGVIYLIGLLVASVVTVILGNILQKFSPPEGLMPTDYSKIRCTQLTLGKSQPISILPLSQTVFGYTLSYLSYFISVNNLQTQNIPTFVIFHPSPIVMQTKEVFQRKPPLGSNLSGQLYCS